MTEPLPEIALTEEEIDQILHSCNGRALLVERSLCTSLSSI